MCPRYFQPARAGQRNSGEFIDKNIIFRRTNIFFSSDTGAPVLSKLPLDPVIGKSCDEGANIFSDETLSESKVVTAYSELTEKLMKIVQK